CSATNSCSDVVYYNNASFVTANQIYGVNASTTFDGDVGGAFNAIQVKTTQGLSATNITAGTVDGTQLADTITLDANLNFVGTASTDFAVNNSNIYVDFSASTVGINTTAPGSALTVIGTVNATGVVVTNLSGTGNAYVCVDATGMIYRSDAACV
ncbi:hypothetical protein JXA85_00835, partial [Candidatus Woesearchaeota archaeon]|nr:hypothetical protein [Candidatus Woesearchaeota archaeon]